ncbi:hypothetical protein HS088_TW14G00522 [Tripterygium wilfordii]|uniref:Uncharacterized protein n=1 Tax=Tripterygium wilfordii TaxID=458696 RepID=A0A7J7CQL5_TRIWF|nr:hypothetical protein HS088_TW14G00522 [Tripterygium wilfordii]
MRKPDDRGTEKPTRPLPVSKGSNYLPIRITLFGGGGETQIGFHHSIPLSVSQASMAVPVGSDSSSLRRSPLLHE